MNTPTARHAAALTCALLLGVVAPGPAPAEPLRAPVPLWHDEAMMFDLGAPLWPNDADAAGRFVVDATAAAPGRLTEAQESTGERLWTVRAARTGTRVFVDLVERERVTLAALTDGVGLHVRAPEDTRVILTFRDAAGRSFRVPMHRQQVEAGEFYGVILNTTRQFDDRGPNEVALPAVWTGLAFDFPDGTREASFKSVRRVSRPIEGLPQKLRLELDDAPLGHLYLPGDTARARFAAPTPDGVVRWQLRDYFGRTLDRGEAPGRVEVEATLAESGYYQFVVELLEDGRRVDARLLGLAAVAPVPRPHERLGISAHVGRGYYKHDVLGLLPRLGVMNIREGVPWHVVEHTPGEMRTPVPYAAAIDRAEAMGVGGIFLAAGRARHYGGGHPRTPEQTAAFIDYASHAWEHARSAMDDLMIWNEWSHGTGMPASFEPTPAGYVAMIEAIVPALRQRFPGVTVIGLGGENPYRYRANLEAMLETGVARHFDSLAFHPYRQPHPPEAAHTPDAEAVDLTMLELLELSATHGGPARIDVTEIGYPTFRSYWGVSERELAQYLPRTLALLHSVPEVHRVYWYCLRDSDEVPLRGVGKDTYSFSQHHFGVVRARTYHYAPKPAAVALATYVRMTADAAFGRAERLPDGVHRVAVTEPDGTPRHTLYWTTGRPVRVNLGRSGLGYTDVMGRSRVADDGWLTVTGDMAYVHADAE